MKLSEQPSPHRIVGDVTTPTHAQGAAGAAPVVLVVDDEQSLAEVLASVLRRDGWTSHTANFARMAARALPKEPKEIQRLYWLW